MKEKRKQVNQEEKKKQFGQPELTTKMDAVRSNVNTSWKAEKYCVGQFVFLKQEKHESSYIQHTNMQLTFPIN